MSQSLTRLPRLLQIARRTSNFRECTATYHDLQILDTSIWIQATRSMSTGSSSQKSDQNKKEPEYVIKFKKEIDVKKIFKEFYSLYGPLFVGCHICISLMSLGTFCTFVYFIPNPAIYLPESLASWVGESALSMTGQGGKYVFAYAAHKSILPIRLGGSIWLTKFLSTKIKSRRSAPTNKET